MRLRIVMLAAFVLASTEAAPKPKRHRDPVPFELIGSEESLAVENRKIDAEGLERFADLDALRLHVALGSIVPVEESRWVAFDRDLGSLDPENVLLYRHARPWTAAFIADLGRETRRKFGRRLEIASLVRTETYQRQLVLINSSAATGATPETRSSHVTGSTFDISTERMPRAMKKWLRRRLLALERQGLIQATEERYTRCFHVMVFPGYRDLWPTVVRKRPRDYKCILR